jgi:ribonuclease VapC
MFIDASAIVAILADEPDGPALTSRLARNGRSYTSPLALYEAVLGLARSLRVPVAAAQSELDTFVSETGAEIIAINPAIGRIAIAAFERYGRGRHPAQLNMGDCFAYACARALGVPLLYKGDDFPKTDIATA